jgi:hypothetical protein
MVMMGPLSFRRSWPVILRVAEIIDAPTEVIEFHYETGSFRQGPALRRDVVDRTVPERPRRCVRIFGEEEKALGFFRRAGPFERRRDVLPVKRVFNRDALAVFEGLTN